jgi:hypothetical protein
MGTKSDPANQEPLVVRWNRKFRNNLYAFIPKSMGFFNQNSGFWKPLIY